MPVEINAEENSNETAKLLKGQRSSSWIHIPYSNNKTKRDALISQIYFWNRTVHVSDRFSVHHQESSTVHTATGICHTGYADCSQHNLYDIYLLQCVQCWTPDDGQRYCPKHVELYFKNKFKKSVHLVGFIIRIYNDARSSECQIHIPYRRTYDSKGLNTEPVHCSEIKDYY